MAQSEEPDRQWLAGGVGSALARLPWEMLAEETLLSLGTGWPWEGQSLQCQQGPDVNASKPVVNTGAHTPV